jgi:type II secretory pathway component PulF
MYLSGLHEGRMPRFEYVTQAGRGAQFVRAFGDAPSIGDLNRRLIRANKVVVRIFDRTGSMDAKQTPRLKLRTKLGFLEQLEASCYLGMDFRTALELSLKSTSRRTKEGRILADVVRDLREKVSRGMSFSRALSYYPRIFDEVAIGLISAGEEGGTLNEALTNVRKIWARNDDLQHRLKLIAIYPSIVLTAAAGVVWLLMTRVVPQFVHVLAEMHATLPWPTRILLACSRIVDAHPMLVLCAAIGFLAVLTRGPAILRGNPRTHAAILRIPGLGKVLRLLLQANFCRTFAQLKSAKARTTDALLLCRDLSWNYQYRSAVARVLLRVQRGESLSAAMGSEVDIFGDLLVNGLAFMEVSGADATGLFRLTDLLERQVDGVLTAIRQILEPALILFLGVVIGGIVFATFLPAIEVLQKV